LGLASSAAIVVAVVCCEKAMKNIENSNLFMLIFLRT
jgi:mevalonate kinase